jgi:hypothetical protein
MVKIQPVSLLFCHIQCTSCNTLARDASYTLSGLLWIVIGSSGYLATAFYDSRLVSSSIVIE